MAISEHWMVSNVVVYLWNYHINDLREGKWAGLTECYKGLLQVLRAQPTATRYGPIGLHYSYTHYTSIGTTLWCVEWLVYWR